MLPGTFSTPVLLQMKASIDKIDESPWDKETQPFQTSIELSEASPLKQSSNRAMKMWKASSFSSQSSGTDVDLFEVDWDLCFICQISVRIKCNSEGNSYQEKVFVSQFVHNYRKQHFFLMQFWCHVLINLMLQLHRGVVHSLLLFSRDSFRRDGCFIIH
jgi:hypothetical protein